MTNPTTSSRLAIAIVGLLACREAAGIKDVRVVGASSSTNSSTAAVGGASGAGGSSSTGSPPCGPDVNADRHNCGACGHDCQGGACYFGKCQPFVIAKNQAGPYFVAVDPGADGDVYWSDNHSIRKTPKFGGGETPLVQIDDSVVGRPRNLALSADKVYFTVFREDTNTFVARVNKDGSGYQRVSDNGWKGTWAIALDDGNVYFTNRYDPSGVVQAPADGASAPTTLYSKVTPNPIGTEQFWAIATDATDVYFTIESATAAGGVYRTKKGGGAVVHLPNFPSSAYGVALDDQYVYWFDTYNGGALRRLRKDLSPNGPDTLAVGSVTSWMALDETYVYWTDENEGTVRRVRKDGSLAVEILENHLQYPQGIAVDATSIYWAEPGGGTVTKLAK